MFLRTLSLEGVIITYIYILYCLKPYLKLQIWAILMSIKPQIYHIIQYACKMHKNRYALKISDFRKGTNFLFKESI